jgi:hypothetical protein
MSAEGGEGPAEAEEGEPKARGEGSGSVGFEGEGWRGAAFGETTEGGERRFCAAMRSARAFKRLGVSLKMKRGGGGGVPVLRGVECGGAATNGPP